jgi:hypothetical protein
MPSLLARLGHTPRALRPRKKETHVAVLLHVRVRHADDFRCKMKLILKAG